MFIESQRNINNMQNDDNDNCSELEQDEEEAMSNQSEDEDEANIIESSGSMQDDDIDEIPNLLTN